MTDFLEIYIFIFLFKTTGKNVLGRAQLTELYPDLQTPEPAQGRIYKSNTT
jgi:hypothetical protein